MAHAALGRYVAVVGTAIFIPLEVPEIVAKVTWLRVTALAINVFAVVYLLWTKRLFGLRGGYASYEAERRTGSLLEVEQAALDRRRGRRGRRGHEKRSRRADPTGVPAPEESRTTGSRIRVYPVGRDSRSRTVSRPGRSLVTARPSSTPR